MMLPDDLNTVLNSLPAIIRRVRVLMDFVEDKDKNLYQHLYLVWNKLLNLQSSGEKYRVYLSKPVCPDHSNCPGWLQGFACESCKFRPV